MTMSSSLHSNAFNFKSFMSNSVDPRTGQYTITIDLPELKANALIGPSFTLKIDYTALNVEDSGYGLGWNLRLSQYTPHNRILSLYTGETYKVTGDELGGEPDIEEKKLNSFRFFHDDEDTWRVVHKSGLVEVLKAIGTGERRVALPWRILGPTGHHIELTYANFNGTHYRLASIHDATGELLRVQRLTSSVKLLLPPFDDQPLTRFTMNLTGGRVVEIVLPVEEQASWRLEYQEVLGVVCIKRVSTPLGGVETLEYRDEGHPFPGTPRPNFPRVTEHHIDPGPGQPVMTTRYDYTETNFLGNGAAIDWVNDGLDQLYKVGAGYTYGTFTQQLLDGQPVRAVDYSFNRFHLLTEEVTTQGRCVKTVSTEYHDIDGPFSSQPPEFQLPSKVITRWSLSDNSTLSRTETVETGFDGYGNQTREVRADGVTTVNTYYIAEGEAGCPEDPDGFVRHIKQQVVTPAAGGEGTAPTLTTHYTYIDKAPLDGVDKNRWMVLFDEQLLEGSTVLKTVHHEYHDSPGDPMLHGRLASDSETLNGLPTFTDYTYELMTAEGVLQTTETLHGFDQTSKILVLQHGLLIGEPVQTYDESDVKIRYTYDTLRRVTSETVAPDSDYGATRSYTYTLTRIDGQRAIQEMTDVKGVQTQTIVDGLNRPVLEQRQDVDGGDGAWRTTYTASFDGLGRKVEECEFDWLVRDPEEGEGDAPVRFDLPLRHTFEYDDWGQQLSDTGPDQVVVYEETDPIGSAQSRCPIVRSWRASQAGKQSTGVTETWINLFGKPIHVERLDTDNKRVSLHEYFYDGLGRTSREVDGLNHVTQYRYDAFDRLVENILPDLSRVQRRFALHSDEDLPIHISVNERELGQQTFDGLSRMVSAVTGGRERTFSYDPGRMQPRTVTTPAGVEITYDYQPELGDEPRSRQLAPGVSATYDYDKENARLVGCEEQGQVMTREYYSTGDLKCETRSEDGQEYSMHYVYSLRGRLLSYTDVFGQVQTYRYDQAGRLDQTILESTTSTFTYDGLGRLHTIETDDNAEQVHVTLTYDDFSREVLRSFDFGASNQQLSQQWNAVDRLTQRTQSEEGALVRQEDYDYDQRGRLTGYTCTGSPPLDAYGKPVQAQLFRFDVMDNITQVLTTFPGGNNLAEYKYDNPADPTQLTSVTNRHEDYPQLILLEYDADGNLIRDEQGRRLDYDALGRLVSVGDDTGVASGNYRYDPLDRLASLTGVEGTEQRFYREQDLANLVQGGQGSTFMRGAGNLLAEHQLDEISLLLGCDQKNTVLQESVVGATSTALAYTAHGYRSASVPGSAESGGEPDD